MWYIHFRSRSPTAARISNMTNHEKATRYPLHTSISDSPQPAKKGICKLHHWLSISLPLPIIDLIDSAA